MIISRTEWGQMIDFLRQNPYVTKEEYMWKWTVPQIKLASHDFTHVVYLTDKDIENSKTKMVDGTNLRSDLNVPIL